MATKSTFGKACECLVQEIIQSKTGFSVVNLNEERANHATTDLVVSSSKGDVRYEVSVKAKDGKVWPSVRGIGRKGQYIIFVDFYNRTYPDFYVLSYAQWNGVLRKILPYRDKGAEIVNGAIEWNWMKSGKMTKRRGSLLRPEDVAMFKGKWISLPSAACALQP